VEEAHENREKVVQSSMFPDKEFLDTIPIENCVRILPHHSDTGGFFVAVFDKVRELDPEIETQIENEANGPEGKKFSNKTREFSQFKGLGMAEVKCHFEYPSGENVSVSLTVEQPKPPKKKYTRDPQDGTLLFVNAHGQDQTRPGRKGFDGVAPVNSPDVVDPINEKYGLHSLQIEKNCVTRTAEGSKPKRVYYVTPNLRQYIAADTRESLRITAIGLKVFERQNLTDEKDSYFGADSKVLSACNYRLNQDGLFLTLPFMTKQAITITIPELLQILKLRGLALVENEPVPEGSKFTPRPSFTDPETRKQVESCSQGSLVCLLRDEDVQKLNATRSEFAITCWKGKTSLNLLVSKVETEHLLEKLKAHMRDANL
jgi:multisite-specific tRNA:(cytosine-C5)-methyltransferase